MLREASQFDPSDMLSMNDYGRVCVSTQDRTQEEERMASNLRRAIELTELALALRLAAMRQRNPACTMVDVMHEIRLQKERAWQLNQT